MHFFPKCNSGKVFQTVLFVFIPILILIYHTLNTRSSIVDPSIGGNSLFVPHAQRSPVLLLVGNTAHSSMRCIYMYEASVLASIRYKACVYRCLVYMYIHVYTRPRREKLHVHGIYTYCSCILSLVVCGNFTLRVLGKTSHLLCR